MKKSSKSGIENSKKSVDITTARIYGITLIHQKLHARNSKLCTVSNGGIIGSMQTAVTQDLAETVRFANMSLKQILGPRPHMT